MLEQNASGMQVLSVGVSSSSAIVALHDVERAPHTRAALRCNVGYTEDREAVQSTYFSSFASVSSLTEFPFSHSRILDAVCGSTWSSHMHLVYSTVFVDFGRACRACCWCQEVVV